MVITHRLYERRPTGLQTGGVRSEASNRGASDQGRWTVADIPLHHVDGGNGRVAKIVVDNFGKEIRKHLYVKGIN